MDESPSPQREASVELGVSAADFIAKSLEMFNSDHPQRRRIEGAQRTTLDNVTSAAESLRNFNTKSDAVYAVCADSVLQHISLIEQVRRELTSLEERVTQCKQRAICIAEHDGVDLSFLDEPSQS